MITHSDLGRPSDNETVERRGNTIYFPRSKRASTPQEKPPPPQQRVANQPGFQTPDAAFKLIYEAKCRDLKMSKTSNTQCQRFIDLARVQCQVPRMCLRNQGLGTDSAKAISKMLASVKRYEYLDVSCNQFGDYGAAAIAWLLERDSSLTMLDYRSNNLGADGGELIFHALQTNRSLTAIDLSTEPGINRNKVGLRGASGLAQALEKNHVLCKVDLSQNSVGIAGAEVLGSSLSKNKSLMELKLCANGLGVAGSSEIPLNGNP